MFFVDGKSVSSVKGKPRQRHRPTVSGGNLLLPPPFTIFIKCFILSTVPTVSPHSRSLVYAVRISVRRDGHNPYTITVSTHYTYGFTTLNKYVRTSFILIFLN